MLPDEEFLRRFGERKTYLTELAETLVKPSIMKGDLVVLRLGRMSFLTTAYFLLNDAYKAKHMKAGHNTEPPKVAALTCMAIMNTLPFRPQNPMHVRTDGELYCNELYAAYCISRILGFAIEPDAKLKRDFYWRLLKILKSAEMKSATLLPFVSDVNNGATGTYANHSLTFSDADEMMADTLIAMCELLCAANGIKV